MTDAACDILNGSTVAVAAGFERYAPPGTYSPGEAYPEYPFAAETLARDGGDSYAAVREALRLLGLDADRFGRGGWNPLGEIVRPGDTVVVKPNFVRHFRQSSPDDGDCLITHGAVLRAVIDYVQIALAGQGRIILADAPHSDADFDALCEIACVERLIRFYARHAKVPLEVCDLRSEQAVKIDGVIVDHVKLPGDPHRYTAVNLGRLSALNEIEHLNHLLYGAEYDTAELHRHHHGDVHEYLIARTVLLADVLINVPKLKTHKKVGLTACMKNLVGVNGNKNWLPHHREGTPAQGGDQYADNRFSHRVERRVVSAFKRVFPWLGWARPVLAGPLKSMGKRVFGDTDAGAIRSGNWHGNDTTWRMVTDLNRIALYADANGRLNDRPVRRVFNIVDGLVGGEGAGPLDPTPKPVGVVIAGANSLAVDTVCARLMGFDFGRIRLLRRAFGRHALPLAAFTSDQIECRSNREDLCGPLGEWVGPMWAFEPHFGWRGFVEWNGYANEESMVAKKPVG